MQKVEEETESGADSYTANPALSVPKELRGLDRDQGSVANLKTTFDSQPTLG